MTHEELDRLWFQAMEESIKDGEMVARYHFAKLIYESAFRDANIAASRTVIDAAVLHEREACAKVCEEKQEYSMPIPCPDGISGCLVAHYIPARREKTGSECAAAIRARSYT